MSCLGVSSRLLSLPNTFQTPLPRSKCEGQCGRLRRCRIKRNAGGQSGSQRAPDNGLKKHVAVLSAIGPLVFALPAFAQVDAAASVALVDTMTVPLLLSGLASGAVFAVLQSKDTKKALSQLAQGVRYGRQALRG